MLISTKIDSMKELKESQMRNKSETKLDPNNQLDETNLDEY